MIRRPPRSTLFPTRRSSDLLHVRQGERFGLIGPNGSGKTTLINCISGTLRNDAGRIVFEGHDLTAVRSEEHTSELQSQSNLVCRLLLEKKKKIYETWLSATQ